MIEAIPEVFSKVVDLGLARGNEKICELPGALIMKIDDNWTVAMHGKRQPIDVPQFEGCMGVDALPGGAVAIWWCGWLAGIVDAGGGSMAWGAKANEDSFIEAIDKAIREAKNVDHEDAP